MLAGAARVDAQGQEIRRWAAGTSFAMASVRMPSVLHEALRELFAGTPSLVAPLLRGPLDLPGHTLVPLDSELTDPRMTQLLPDVVLACPSVHTPEVVVIVEVHLAISEPKRRVWPQYVAAAYGRYGCRVELVVITPSVAVERWAATPIAIGHRHTMAPVVFGPNAIPLLDKRQIEAAPVLAMLSTLAHMEDPRCAEQALLTLGALSTWSDDAGARLADILQAALPTGLREGMEVLMQTGKYEYKSDLAKKHFARGHQEGLAEGRAAGQQAGRVAGLEEGRAAGQQAGRAAGQVRALLLVLRSRGLHVPPDRVARIEREQDQARLDVWTRRAMTAADVDAVFIED